MPKNRASAIFGASCTGLFIVFMILCFLWVFVVEPVFGVSTTDERQNKIIEIWGPEVSRLETADLVVANWGGKTEICYFVEVTIEEITIIRFDSFLPESHLAKNIKVFDTISRQNETEKYKDHLMEAVNKKFGLEPI